MGITKEHMTMALCEYKKTNRTPFVIEVLGTPNSGKTSAIQTFEKILKRNGIKHKIIFEAASRCKIKNKLSPEFNLWTLSETVKQLLDVYSNNYDIVICQRGLLDAICWFDLYYQDGKISKEEYHRILDYTLMNRFVELINCCYIMGCSVSASIKRENLSGLLDTTGTIVNDVVLSKYNNALTRCQNRYGSFFKKIINMDTTALPQTDINLQFVSSILDYLQTLR